MPYSTSWPSGEEACAAVAALWERVYGNFPAPRYDWLYVSNPAGPARVCLLRDDDSATVVGSTALLPRRLCSNGTILSAGIAADLMVDQRHRSLGPSIILQKGILGRLAEAGISVVYAFPNPKSIPMTRRIGYRQVAERVALVLPLRSEPFLRGRIPQAGARRLAALLLDLALYLRPRLFRPIPTTGFVPFTATAFDAAFDDLWSRISTAFSLVGEKTAAFLNWRYRDSPQEQYAVFGLRNQQGIAGYVVHFQRDRRLYIADFAWDPARISLEELLIRFARWGRSTGAEAVSIALAASPDLLRRWQRAGFHLREVVDPLIVFTPDGQAICIESGPDRGSWYLVPGDNDA